ncbi:MAG: hypothetical protein QXU18_10865 [Thermoplasmatales archaeon]
MIKGYPFKDKQYALEIIIFETVRKPVNYVSENAKNLDIKSPVFTIEWIDSEMMERILTTTSVERKAKYINKSTLWYQKKMLNEGKAIKFYDKVRGMIE